MISVVVPTFNRAAFLRATLECLFAQISRYPFEILVVDAGTDDSHAMARELFGSRPELTYVKTSAHRNRSKLRNIGAARARYELLFFLDGDMLLSPDTLQAHVEYHSTAGDVAVLGRRSSLTEFDLEKLGPETLRTSFEMVERLPSFSDVREPVIAREGRELSRCASPWRFFFSHSFSIRKETFARSGGFHEDFGENWGYEDLELGFRLNRLGVDFLLDRDRVGYHQPHLEQSRREQPLATRNAILLSSLYRSFEVEIVSLMGTDDRSMIDHLRKLQAGLPLRESWAPAGSLVLGYLHSELSTTQCPAGWSLGVFLQGVKSDAVPLVTVLPTFDQMDDFILTAILAEAFRISSRVEFLSWSEAIESRIQRLVHVLGVKISIGPEGQTTIVRRHSRGARRILTLVLPSPFEPRKRLGFLMLANYLHHHNFGVVLKDPKRVSTLRGDGLDDEQANKLGALLDSPLEYLSEQTISSEDYAMSPFAKSMTSKDAYFRDLGFPAPIPSIAARPMDTVLWDQLLWHSAMVGQPPKESAEARPGRIIASMMAGFDEDGLAAVVDGFELFCRTIPFTKLEIFVPDEIRIFDRCMRLHNRASKLQKLLPVLRKAERDLLRLLSKVHESPVRDRISLTTTTLSEITQDRLFRDCDLFVCASKGSMVPPELLIALRLNLACLVPDTIRIEFSGALELVKRLPTEMLPFAEVFGLPPTSSLMRIQAFEVSPSHIADGLVDLSRRGIQSTKARVEEDGLECESQLMTSVMALTNH